MWNHVYLPFLSTVLLCVSIFTLVCRPIRLPASSPAIPDYICPPILSVTLYDFLVFQAHSLYFPHQFQPIYIPVSPSSSLSLPLKSVTYIQHSCLMNNGGETVTISISIRRISFDLCCSQLPRCLSSQLSSQVSSHFYSLLTVWTLQQ